MTFMVGVLLIAALVAGPACATKGFVKQEMATLDQKVEGVETSVEENQKRIKEHDERLTTLGSLITQQDATLKDLKSETDSQITEVKKLARGKLIFQVTLKNDAAKFKFDSSELSDEAKSALDAFVQQLVSEDRGVYLEIQGHTDSTGPADWNMVLGKKRADAVMQYLHIKYNIPLFRMETISYGSENPIADNATREGRSQNRRVEILVYE